LQQGRQEQGREQEQELFEEVIDHQWDFNSFDYHF
jgi:hypothetical protein